MFTPPGRLRILFHTCYFGEIVYYGSVSELALLRRVSQVNTILFRFVALPNNIVIPALSSLNIPHTADN